MACDAALYLIDYYHFFCYCANIKWVGDELLIRILMGFELLGQGSLTPTIYSQNKLKIINAEILAVVFRRLKYYFHAVVSGQYCLNR